LCLLWLRATLTKKRGELKAAIQGRRS
jgi:hypothetical protein